MQPKLKLLRKRPKNQKLKIHLKVNKKKIKMRTINPKNNLYPKPKKPNSRKRKTPS